MENKVMLITYPDSLGKNLAELKKVIDGYYDKAVGGIHVLPFFPSSGDRGFAPLEYRKIDPRFGSWEDMAALAENHELMYDYMINHISCKSPYYEDFLEKKEASPYRDLFIRYKDFWENGMPTEEQTDQIYKRKPRAPYVTAHFADGTREPVWCTFSEEQIDLNMDSGEGRRFLEENIRFLARHGAKLIRLDAFAYAVKKAGTSCFFVEPQIWELLERCARIAGEEGALILPEIHEHYSIQLKLAQKGYWVYDFALPLLLLHALYFGNADYLKHWFDICPRNQFTTLDTHDGLGVVDVRDLLPEEEIEAAKEHLFRYGANVKKIYNTEKYNNLDIYQVNCTYYSALGDRDDLYVMARAVQFFAPGIPQIYYVGMLAGKNDLELLERTKEGRNINRHYYTLKEIEEEMKRPVVQKIRRLMELRSSDPAFQGEFYQEQLSGGCLKLGWRRGEERLELTADFKEQRFQILRWEHGSARTVEL